MEVTRELAKFVTRTSFEDLPADVITMGKKCLLNWLGVAIGACKHPSVDMAISVAKEVGDRKEATVFGREEKLDVFFASLVNGMSSHIFDFDDTHLETVIHPTGPVAPVAFALGEKFELSGREVLLSFILGAEVELRVGKTVYPAHYDVGWHITSTAGTFGAAAAAGRLLDLDEDQMVMALGLAATQASGLREMFGTMTKPFHVGKAAMNGLLSATLAKRGFTSSKAGIEAKRGFASVTASNFDLSKAIAGLGNDYELMRNAFKPYACGVVSHPVIDAAIKLRNEYNIKPEEVKELNFRVNPLVTELTGKTEPVTGLEGKFSSYHSAAVSLIDGQASVAQYSDDKVIDPLVVAMRRKVNFREEKGIRKDECFCTAVLKDGKEVDIHIDHALGSIECPMSQKDLENKFRALTESVIPLEQTNKWIEQVKNIEAWKNCAQVIASITK